MRARIIVVLTATATAAALTAGTGDAATLPDLFVDNAVTTCSDTGPGTQAQPFCTVQHAADLVAPGQTVRILAGIYSEDVTISHSGSPGEPITFAGPAGALNPPLIVGKATGMSLAGVHDVVVSGVNLGGPAAMSITDSSAVTVDTVRMTSALGTSGLTLSGQTSDVTISRDTFGSFPKTAAVAIDAGVTGTTVTTNFFQRAGALGNVLATDAPGTIITGNTMESACHADVVLAGGSTGSTVENNILDDLTTPTVTSCTSPPVLSVDADSAAGTTADYNVVWASGRDGLYSWADTAYGTKADFTAATGQGAHDISADPKLDSGNLGRLAEGSPAIDSADANAPGELPTDRAGKPRGADDLLSPNAGTGSGTVDRGAFEIQDPYELNRPTTNLSQAPAPVTVTIDANPFNPWGTPGQYTFTFGDGSPPVTTSATSVTHTYTGPPGTYQISVSVVTADGLRSTQGGSFEVTAQAPLVAHVRALQRDVLAAQAINTETGSFAVFDSGFSTDFGDGSAPVVGQEDPIHGYAEPGTYTITTTVTDEVGHRATAAQRVTIAGAYVPVNPVRVLDTRNGTGVPTGKLGPNGTLTLHLAGTHGITETGATAVALNVTAANATTGGVLTVYPDGTPKPTASSLNFGKGQTVPNLVTVPLGADGSIDITNLAGTVDVVADLEGFYDATAQAPVELGPVPIAAFLATTAPTRLLDTRKTGGPLGPNGVRKLAVPADANAVVLNMTETGATAGGVLTVWPDGQPKPVASNLNFSKGQTTSNMVVVPVIDGSVDIGNLAGNVNVVADLEGYYREFEPPSSSFTPAGPTRLLDTRKTGGALGANTTRGLQVAGMAGVPADATAVTLNVTVTTPTTGGFLTVYPDGTTRPTASDLNFTAGETIANQVVVPIGPDGRINLFNLAGSTQVVVDLAGWFQD